MTEHIRIDAFWDNDARVWVATSADAPGLVVEADDWATMIAEVNLVLPELKTTSRHERPE